MSDTLPSATEALAALTGTHEPTLHRLLDAKAV